MATNFHQTPGVKYITHGGSVTTTPPPPSGDTLLIVGQALDGPVNYPMTLTSIPNINKLFGPTVYDQYYTSPDGDLSKKGAYSGNNLVESVHEALQGGATSIIVVRTGGTLAADSTHLLLGGMTITAQFPGAIYNGLTLTAVSSATGTIFTATQPKVKGGNFTVTYDPSISYGSIAQQFNQDKRNGSFVLTCPSSIATGKGATVPVATATATLIGGTNGTLNDDFAGTSKSALFTALTDPDNGTLAYIDGVKTDFLYFAGIYADDDIANSPTTSFITTLAQFCEDQSNNSYPVHAFIGVRPATSNSRVAIKNRANALANTTTSYLDVPSKQVGVAQFLQNGISYVDSTGAQTVALGKHISVHAGPDVIFTHDNDRGQYIENPAAYYAGMIVSRDASQGGINMAVGPTVAPFYTYSNQQVELLSDGVGFNGQNLQGAGGAFVTFRTTNNIPGRNSLTVTEDVTCDLRTSVFGVLQHFRIVCKTEAAVGETALLFRGQPNIPSTLTTMQSQIRTTLDELASRSYYNGGFGSGYKFTVTPRNSGTLGGVDIAVSVRPGYEIRDIDVDLSVDL